ncbi:L-histidine N(alpha)-methyltransferase [Methylovirgula sp. HY1]|uniref:L-histidine N(alpha)-methyltransferase n=1 Tax=Methylovirgula sp. HY1 TaxID=2822761 RepID=UPI001C792E9B|nr:L-histidine N(alpha)-methyltransferase [Methylovirgula sp. HY1]QXX76474.1 Histidine N-alpha-methyltransferase [Methylovirgula sp. HY1]
MSNTLQKLQDLEPSAEEFAAAVHAGLSQAAKSLPCKFFYDFEGSRLFDRICELPEYYPTRTESRILEKHAGDIAQLIGPGARLVEFGSGAGVKIRLLLSALARPAAYVPVDISRLHLLAAASSLAKDFPRLVIAPICADYTKPFDLPAPTGAAPGATIGFFPGSTIGNFTPDEARLFLVNARQLLGRSSLMLVGVDLRKDEAVLVRAYDDAAGVTAAFNLNLLRRINRELGGTFQLDEFTHRARWNDVLGRMEMHLVSRRAQTVEVDGRRFSFAAGEAIHTENSHKYSISQFQALAGEAGYAPRAVWTDEAELFSVHLLEDARSPGKA